MGKQNRIHTELEGHTESKHLCWLMPYLAILKKVEKKILHLTILLNLPQTLMGSLLAHPAPFHQVSLESVQRFWCNPVRWRFTASKSRHKGQIISKLKTQGPSVIQFRANPSSHWVRGGLHPEQVISVCRPWDTLPNNCSRLRGRGLSSNQKVGGSSPSSMPKCPQARFEMKSTNSKV